MRPQIPYPSSTSFRVFTSGLLSFLLLMSPMVGPMGALAAPAVRPSPRAASDANRPATAQPADAREPSGASALTPLVVVPVTATLTDNVALSSKVDKGGTITYDATITNTSGADIPGFEFQDTPDANTTLVGGSISVSPVARDDSNYTATGNIPISVPAGSGVLQNDFMGTPTATISAFDATSAQGGTVSVAADGSFTYTPPGAFTGTDTFHYTLTNTLGSSTATATITVNDRILFVDDAGSGTACTSGSPCTLSTADGKTAASGKDLVYVFSGTYSSAAFSLLSNQSIVGQGVSFSQALTDVGITLAPNSTAPTLNASTVPVFNNNATIITLVSSGSNLIEQLTLNPSGGSGILGNNVTSETVTVKSVTIGATSTANGVSLTGTNTSSTFNFNNIAVTSASGIAFNATGGGTVNATQDNSTTVNTLSSGTGIALNVTSTTIGASGLTFRSISADGGVSHTGTNGIVLSSTGSNAGLTVTGQSTTAGTGGTIQNESSSGIKLTSVKSLTLSNMNLTNNAQTNGTVNTTCGNNLVAGDTTGCSANLYLSSVSGGVSLTNLSISGSKQEGIAGTSVTGFTLANSTISGNGDEDYENGFLFKNLTGTVSITGTTVRDNFSRQTHIYNDTGSLSMTVSGSRFGRNNAPTVSSQQGMLLELAGTSHGDLDMGTSTIDNNGNGNGLAISITSTATLGSSGTHSSMHNMTSLTNNAAHVFIATGGGGVGFFDTMNNTVMTKAGLQSIDYFANGNSGSPGLTGIIQGNTIGTTGVAASGCATALGGCDGMTIDQDNSGALSLRIQSNVIQEINTNGIALHSNITNNLNASITSNTIREPSNTAAINSQGNAFLLGVGTSSGSVSGSTACVVFTGNTIQDTASKTWDINGSGAAVFSSTQHNSVTRLPGAWGSGTAAATTFLTNNNTYNLSGGAAPVLVQTATGGTIVSGAACSTPLLFAPGGVSSALDGSTSVFNFGDFSMASMLAPVPGMSKCTSPAAPTVFGANATAAPTPAFPRAAAALTQQQLDAVVEAAIRRWAATGLTDEQVKTLRAVRFEISDLAGAYLGEAEGDRVMIDRDAEGHGWFVDPNPLSDRSFAHPVSATQLYADPSGAPAGRVDLLTAIEHEMGHHLKLNDTYSAAERDNLMYGYLTLGERRLPARGQAAHADATASVGPHFLTLSGDAPRRATINRAAPSRRAPANAERKAEGGTLKVAPAAATLFTAPPVDVTIGGALPGGTGNKTVKIRFQVTVNNSLSPANTTQVQTQGTVLATGFTSKATDDPETGAAGDATVTNISRKDLALTNVTDNNTTTTPGSTLTYVITYSNPGHAATGVVITETVPTGTTFNSGSSSAGWSCAPDNNAGSTCTNTIGSLAAGAGNATINFAVTVNTPAASHLTTISDTASIDDDHAYEADFDTSNNSSSDSTTLNAEPAFGTFTKDDGTTTTTPGSTLTYTINYANTGNQDAVGVVLTETVPTGTTYVATGSSSWSCADNSPAGTTCTITVGNLAGGGGSGSATFKVTVLNPAAAGLANIVNNASIADDGSNTTGSSTPKTAAAQDTDTLNAAPDLFVGKTPDVTIIGAGQTITYTVNYANNGNQGATGVVVTETVPANTTFVASGSSTWTGCADGAAAGTVCTNTVGALAAGGNGSLTFKVKVNNSIPGGTTQITNTATIDDDHANGTDPNTADNTTGNVNTTLCQSSVTVTNTNDSGAGSLRDAVSTVCPNGTITFQIPSGDANHSGGVYTIKLTSGELALNKNLTINGPNSGADTDAIVVSGNDASRVFNVGQNLTVSISNLTATHGNTTGGASGGAIVNNEGSKLTLTGVTVSNSNASGGGGGVANLCTSASPTLILEGSTVSGNTAAGDLGGGGIYTECSGTLYVDNSAIDGNHSTANGGGTYGGGGISVNAGALLSVSNSTISNNTASKDAGGIFAANSTASQITLINSTLSGNSTNGNGGGLYGRATLVNTTVTNNRADADGDSNGTGGGLYINTLTVSLLNSIVAGNFHGTGSTSDDIDTTGGGSATGSNNLIGTGGSGGLTDGSNGNQVGVADAKLGALANNGGPTKTHALLAGSPAVDAGTDVTTLSADVDNASVTTIDVTDASSIPDKVNFVIQVDSEQMTVTGKSANTLTVVRGANSTTAASHTNGAAVNPAFDQRGTPFHRKTEGKANSSATVDIGAYEVQPPTAVDDSYSTSEDTPLHVNAPGVLSNDTGTGTKTATVGTGPSHASSFTLNSDGSFDYTPASNFNGQDTFTYTVTDSGGGSASATATITVNSVNDAPTTSNNTVTVLEDHTYTFLTSDFPFADTSDNPPNTLANVIVTSAPASGTLSDNGTPITAGNVPFAVSAADLAGGKLTFAPAANDNGTGYTSFNFEVQDNGGGSDTSAPATMTIDVTAVNDPPSFTKGADQTVNEDAGAQSVSNWATSISAGPANENGQTVTFNVTNNTNTALFSAQPAVDSSGTLTYTPAANANGSATITLTLSDNGGTANGGSDTSAPQTFVINVTAVNDPPSFTKGADQTVNEDAGAQTVNNWATNISAGPSDENGQTLTFNVTNNTNTALFSVQPAVSSTGTLTYTPAANANGSATITLTLSDNGGTANGGSDTSAPQTFQITVNAVADTPSVTDATTNEDTQTTSGLVISRNAADGSEVTNFKITNIQHGTLFKNDGTTQINSGDFITFAEGNAGLRFTPAADFNDSIGTASFVVQASTSSSDGGLGGGTATATIHVTAVNDAPVFTKGANQSVPLNAGPQSVPNWATGIAPGPATATDEAGQTLNFIVTNDNNGLFSSQPAVSSSGTLTYTPASNTSGQATVSVSLHDNGGTANGGSDTSAVQTFTITVGMPSLTAHDAQAAEPSTGTAKMIFTVTMSSALASQTVTVNYATADGTATAGTCGNSGADYQSTSGTLTFSPGDTTKTVEVTICADGDANSAAASETLTLNLSGASGAIIAGTQATGTITHTNAPGTFIISEIRTSGPAGAGDDFVELYNNTDSPLTVAASDASGGYGVFKMGATCTDSPVLVAQIPNGTVIPARGHYLLVGSAYSLSAYAVGDQTMTSDIENDRNVAVFTTSDAGNLSTVTRLDAVGFGSNVDTAPVVSDSVTPGKHPQAAISTDTPTPSGGICDLFREGTNLPAASGSTLEYSFFRNECDLQPNQGCTAQGNPKDSNDNAADFLFADTLGTPTTMGQRLGAPGPENKTSPIHRDSTISMQLLDSSVSSSANINRFRDPTPNTPNANTAAFGTLSIRRRVANNTGGDVTRLRFRIIEITTFPNAAGNADLRAITSSDASVSNVHDTTTCVDRTAGTASNCTVTVKGTLLEQPPTQTSKGGGYNSTLSVDLSGLPGGKLAAGQSTEVQLQLGVMQPGSFRVLVIIEALP